MAVSIPGLSLSILRQQTTVRAGLPLLVSGRFTAFGLGVPAFIRVFLEGPSYDPQIRSFDTFASPFSGDYTVNVIAEKDGSYNVYSQAFPPPLLPTGPPLPEAILLLPPMAESTHPPLAVGIPFDGGVEALLPDGTRQRIEAPALQPIEFQPFITVGAPGITIGLPGAAPPVAALPWYPTEIPGAPPAPPGVPTYARAVVDDILFTPPMINPGQEATGVMLWRNTGEAPNLFDSVFYLVSPEGVRYGPLQVTQQVSANPQVPATQNVRLSTAGIPSGIYTAVVEIYDSATGALLTTRSLLNRLEIREIAAPVPPAVPPPVIPVPPTIDILGTPTLNLPSQVQVGDVWAGSVILPTFATVPVFIESRLLLRDAQGMEYIVGQGGRTLSPSESLEVPVNLDTTGFSAGNYTILLRAFDQVGNQLAEFPMGALSMIAAAVPEIPVPAVPPPPVVGPPTLPTANMFSTPSVNLPSQLEIGEIWQGNITIPTMVPTALQALPSLPAFPVNINLQLQSPTGQMFNVGSYRPTFTPGQTINLPVSFDTSVLPEQGIHNLIMSISDLQGNTLFSNVIGALRALMPAIPPPPTVPEVPLPSKFSAVTVLMGPEQVQVGGSVTVPLTYTHVGGPEIVTLRAAIGDARPAYLGGFDEVWWADKTVSVPAHAIPTTVPDSITIQITPKLLAAGIYSVYAKVDGGIPKAISPVLTNIIEVVAPAAPPVPAPPGLPPVPPVLPSADIADYDFQIITVGTFNPGNTISWVATGKYRGRTQGGRLTISMGTGPLGTFFTRFTLPTVPVSFNESYDWQNFSFRGNFTIPANVELGQTYSIRGRLETFMEPTQETDTDWGIIRIAEAAPAPPPPPPAPPPPPPALPRADIQNVDFVATRSTYELGANVPFTITYEYRGRAQRGRLLVSLGTGVYPTFIPVVNYDPMSVSFNEARDWTRFSFSGTFRAVNLQRGQLYNTRARLETLDEPTQETDTDWGIIRIAEAAPAPPPPAPTPPPPAPAPPPPPPGYKVTVSIRPLAAGWVTKSPDKSTYSYGETVRLTARNAPGYRFSSWTVAGEWAGSSTILNLMVTRDLEVIARFSG